MDDKEATHYNEEGVWIPRTALDWDGPDDPDNPMNWHTSRRYYHLFMASLLSFAATYPASAYSPAIHDVTNIFNVSREVSTLGITTYVLGLGFGPMLASGISESYGRRPVYLGLTPIAILFSLGAGFSQNITTLLICRFLAGCIGSAPLSVGVGTAADVSLPRYRAMAIGIWVFSPFSGPAFGPSTTSYAVQDLGWRWFAWCIVIVGGTCYALSFWQRETYKKVILKRRAKKYGLPPPHDPIPEGAARVKFLFNVTVVRSSHMLVTEPIVAWFSTFVAFLFAITFGFFAGVPYIYKTVYGFGTGASGLPFLALGIGSLCATVAFVVIDRKTYVKKLLAGQGTAIPPEERLYSAMVGAILVPIGLFWFAWTARPSVHWICPTIALGVFGTGNLMVFDSCSIYIADVYGPLLSASATAGNNFLRYAAGAACPLFIIQMFEAMTIKWAITLMGCISVVLAFIPFIFYRYGKVLRARSSYDTNKL